MKYIESPSELVGSRNLRIFLAGGITNCPDWQQVVAANLKDVDGITLLNPRRADFPIDDPTAAKSQITWEYNMLREADIILFWFPKDTLCPIVLYELGAHAGNLNKPIVVGTHPEYKRIQDVTIQVGLVRDDVNIVDTLSGLLIELRRKIQDIENKFDN